MEIIGRQQQQTSLTTKKLCGIIRAILYILKKRLSKNIPWFALHMMLKRSTKLAGKALGTLLFDHQTLTCRPNATNTSFIAPLEYQFSCSNTLVFNLKRKNNRLRSHKGYELSVHEVRKVFDVLNSYEYDMEPEKSPLTVLGFGESGMNVRQLRVSDSPFPENYMEEKSLQVDMKAEEFIKNFYKELKQQKMF
ncbi:uncharacterized protein LOC143601327 [Bidens hawaiensis]|uniref:uncharacterized protein LOC143601327 n=1 Tax=Bidens hawaiensis TaxID=980011 RepID=UPI0040497026